MAPTNPTHPEPTTITHQSAHLRFKFRLINETKDYILISTTNALQLGILYDDASGTPTPIPRHDVENVLMIGPESVPAWSLVCSAARFLPGDQSLRGYFELRVRESGSEENANTELRRVCWVHYEEGVNGEGVRRARTDIVMVNNNYVVSSEVWEAERGALVSINITVS